MTGIALKVGALIMVYVLIVAGIEWVGGVLEERGRHELQLSQCSADIEALKGTIEDQNQGVRDAKKLADERAAEAVRRAKAAEAQAAKHKARADTLENTKPSRPSDLCGSLDDLLTEYITGRRSR